MKTNKKELVISLVTSIAVMKFLYWRINVNFIIFFKLLVMVLEHWE